MNNQPKRPLAYQCFRGSCNGKQFINATALKQHQTTSTRENHRTLKPTKPKIISLKGISYTCCDCDRNFKFEGALAQHLRDKYHAPRVILTTTMCTICHKDLKTKESLAKHMNSSVHKNLPGAKCPGCGKKFSLVSTMTQHLEGGKCKSGINRLALNTLINSHDKEGVITINPNPIGMMIQAKVTEIEDIGNINDWESGLVTPSEYHSDDGGVPLMTPTSSRSRSGSISTVTDDGGVPILTPTSSRSRSGSISCSTVTGLLTPVSINSSITQDLQLYRNESGHYICQLCPFRTFSTPKALKSQMLSAAHSPKIFKCPTNLFTEIFVGKKSNHKKMKKFTTLSGLTQHLESEACRGGRKGYELAIKTLGQKFIEMGLGSKWIGMGIGS